MGTTSFNTRIDTDLKSQLDQIAQFEDRSSSYFANQAIKAFVEERLATRELVKSGLAMVEQGAEGIDPADIHSWIMADDDRAFPDSTPS